MRKTGRRHEPVVIRLFISSVQKEFADIRKILKRYVTKNPAYRRLFDAFVFEEDVVATDRRVDEVYLDELGSCDVYIGLIGNEYGFEDKNGVSPTEREFDEASRLGLPRLVFVRGRAEGDRHPKETAFLKKVSEELIRARCDDDATLLLEIYSSLDGLLVERGTYRFGPFDASPCEGATLKDISRAKVREFLAAAKMKRGLPLALGTPVEKVLRHFHLLSADGTPLNSAVLLFGKNPQGQFLSSQVKCVEWPTEKRGKPIKDHRNLSGTLPDLADAAIAFVLDKLEKRIGSRSEGTGGVAPTSYDIPREAVAEAIVNGIAHRDYSNPGSVQVELFPDRLLVMSPGKPHPLADVAHLDQPHESFPVNPLIAEVFYQTGHIERLGTGLEDLFRVCREAGLPKPKIEVLSGEFHITVFRNRAMSVSPVSVPQPENGTIEHGKGAIDGEKGTIEIQKRAFGDLLQQLKCSRPRREKILALYAAFGTKSEFGRREAALVVTMHYGALGKLFSFLRENGLILSVKGHGKGRYLFCGSVPDGGQTALAKATESPKTMSSECGNLQYNSGKGELLP